jgi:uncharacterized membrane-anchored protein YitT (DUF2179 family)
LNKHLYPLLMILLGSFIFSIGINTFAIANHLAEGGFTGIAILVHYVFGWSTGYTILLLNIPLFFIGYRILGRKTMIYTIIGILATTLFLEYTKDWQRPLNDLLLAALYTGLLVGTGLGLIFRAGGTTGGVDIIARLCQKYFGLSIGQVILVADLLVITASIFIVGIDIMMYTLVSVFVGSRVIDFVVEGLTISKSVTIISNSAEEMANIITTQLERGVTIYSGKGAYTGDPKQILYVIVSPRQVPKLKQIISKVDPKAFVIVHDVREVIGEGFTFQQQKRSHS